MAEETQVHVGFKIHGDWFTQHVRDRVIEGDWRGAFDLIMDSFDGITAENAMDVLQGKLRFEGVNAFELEEEDGSAEAAMTEALNRRYRRCFLFKGVVYQVYGYVGVVCEQDNTWACSPESQQYFLRKNARAAYEMSFLESSVIISATGRNRREHGHLRCSFYLRGPEDILITTQKHSIACQPVCEANALPLWLRMPRMEGAELFAFLDEAAESVSCIAEWSVRDYLATERRSETRVFKASSNMKTEEEYEEENRQHEARLKRLQEEIQARADAEGEKGWMTVTKMIEGRNETLRIPRTPLVMFVCSLAKAWHLIPEDYTPVCESGLKMMNDSPYHSDAWLGAGLALEKAYDMDSVPYQLFYEAVSQVQEEVLNFKFTVLSKGAYARGTVIHNPKDAGKDKILVVKNASPEYADAAVKCAGVVCENGSALTHLATVMRESSLTVMRGDNALTMFPVGSKISLFPDSGSIEFNFI